MNFNRTWTQFAADAEVDHFGTKRIVDAHNAKVAALEAKLSKMEETLKTLADPLSYEHIEKFHGRKLPWSLAKEALAGGDE